MNLSKKILIGAILAMSLAVSAARATEYEEVIVYGTPYEEEEFEFPDWDEYFPEEEEDDYDDYDDYGSATDTNDPDQCN